MSVPLGFGCEPIGNAVKKKMSERKTRAREAPRAAKT